MNLFQVHFEMIRSLKHLPAFRARVRPVTALMLVTYMTQERAFQVESATARLAPKLIAVRGLFDGINIIRVGQPLQPDISVRLDLLTGRHFGRAPASMIGGWVHSGNPIDDGGGVRGGQGPSGMGRSSSSCRCCSCLRQGRWDGMLRKFSQQTCCCCCCRRRLPPHQSSVCNREGDTVSDDGCLVGWLVGSGGTAISTACWCGHCLTISSCK